MVGENVELRTFMRVEKHIIKKKHPLYSIMDAHALYSKNIYNFANYVVRQVFILVSKMENEEELEEREKKFLEDINYWVEKFNSHRMGLYVDKKIRSKERGAEPPTEPKLLKPFGIGNKYPNYYFIDFYCRMNCPDYGKVLSQSAQGTLRLLDKNWISFFKAIKVWAGAKEKFKGRPKLPKYIKKDGRNIVILNTVGCKLVNGNVVFPKKYFNSFQLKTSVKGKLQQIRVLPRFKHMVLEVVYKVEKNVQKLEDNGRYIAIDMGIDNFATIVNNFGEKPVAINGRGLKSINRYFNLKVGHYQSVAMKKNGVEYTNRLNRMNLKRSNRISDFMHKASKGIVGYCKENRVNTIILGDFKGEEEGEVRFIRIPHQQFVNMLMYKADELGITLLLQEETYTSVTSYVDGEEPVQENQDRSRRKTRGLFVSNNGIEVNADVNAAYQIMRKVLADYKGEVDTELLHPLVYNVDSFLEKYGKALEVKEARELVGS